MVLRNLNGKKVILRVDFNFPFEYKIIRTLPTIHALLKNGATIVLMTHLDKEGAEMIIHEGKEQKKNFFHLDYLAKKLKKIFPSLLFVRGAPARAPEDFFIKNKSKIILLDNLRLCSGEEKNNKIFGEELATWGDYYANEAFAVSHRAHASIVTLPRLLPHFSGALFDDEIKNLSKLFNTWRPFFLAIGGLKFSTKEPLLERFLDEADNIFLGGAIANAFMEQRGLLIGRSRVEKQKIPKHILLNKKIILPDDVMVVRKGRRVVVRVGGVEREDTIYDIGPETIARLTGLTKTAKTVLWNGTFGLCEDGYVEGTRSFAEAIKKSQAFSVVGGGDTVAAIEQLRLQKNFDFISTGGGAMLEFLAKGTLPGIEALKNK